MNQIYIPDEISSLTSIGKRKKCNSCGLYLNQLPVFDKQKLSSIFWVGLSAVQFSENEEKMPLSPITRTGALIHDIEQPYLNDISFYKTNIVKCLPLFNSKVRYPIKHEMEKCYPNLEDEIEILKPTLIFLLGKQVGTFVLDKFSKKIVFLRDDFNYEVFLINEITYVPVHHPSYILVYKRKYILDYIKGIQSLFEKSLISATSDF